MAVTIYDVAKEAGVSIATVSKALNDSYTIPDQTKAAIREIADRLGYRPNARAKNFARQASGTVLFITDFYQNIAFENPHMFEITKYRTIPIHVQYLKGSYGTVDLGATMAVIMMAILPIIIVYLFCQKYIIKGVAAGAVKG